MTSEPLRIGRILALEGSSGTGKTTFVQSLAEKKRLVVIPELPQFIRSLWIRPGDPDTWEANLIPMLEGGLIRLDAARQFAQRGYDVILDRSLLSPLAIVSSLRTDQSVDFGGLRRRCLSLAARIPPLLVDMILLDPPPAVWDQWLASHPKAKGYWGSVNMQQNQQDFFRRVWTDVESFHWEGDTPFPIGASGRSGDFATVYQRACALLDQ